MPRTGHASARRAVVRWAWRMFRREWRQQILVMLLLTVAVASAIGSVTIAYNASSGGDAEYGSANHLLRFDGADPGRLQAALASSKRWFRSTDTIGHRAVAVPGSFETVDFRTQDPHGVYARDLLALRRGRYPARPGQVAVTDSVAALLGRGIGQTMDLDGHHRTVVGIVENPRKFSDEFVLVPASSAEAADYVTVLVHAGGGSFNAFRQSSAGLSRLGRPALLGYETRSSSRGASALGMFSVATVFLLLALLVAAAGFAVIARRRLRQLGTLAAIGATKKHLRLVLLTNGSVVGTIGAVLGTTVGLGFWFAIGPTLEPMVNHRIDPLSLPWGQLVLVVLVAVLGATAAAWWPGRAVARVPIMLALSVRPPAPRATRHSTVVAAGLITAGIGSLALAHRSSPPLIVAGILATMIGTLLLGPLAIRLCARAATHAPIAGRWALRALARYQARSGAALAAITLALGIAAAIVIISAGEQKRAAAEPRNLSNRQIRIYNGPTDAPELVPIQTSAQLGRMAAGARQLAARFGHAALVPLEDAYQPGTAPEVVGGARVLPTIDLTRQVGGGTYRTESRLYVATPPVLHQLGIHPATVDPRTDFLADPAVPTDQLVILGTRQATTRDSPVTRVQRINSRQLFGSPKEETGLAPSSFITPSALRRRGWKEIPAGWLLESKRPLTSQQIAVARDLAANAGLTIETRRAVRSLAKPIAIATAAGALLALAILAMTVGLIRNETATDLRPLTATGATSTIRRTLTATTAGALALLGALLGTAGAYLALTATYLNDLQYLSRAPVVLLLLTVLGVPLPAAVTGWLLAGREPIARRIIE